MKSKESLIRGCKLLLPKVEEDKENEFEAYVRKVKY